MMIRGYLKKTERINALQACTAHGIVPNWCVVTWEKGRKGSLGGSLLGLQHSFKFKPAVWSPC